MKIAIEEFRTAEAFAILREEWNSLLGESTSNHIFLTWQWQSAWWSAYHPGELWILAAREENGDLVGLFPWFIQDMSSGRTVRSVGCVEVTDYLEPLLKLDHERPVLEAVADFLVIHRDRYDTIDLCNIPGESKLLEVFPTILEKKGFNSTVSEQDVCPILELPHNWDDYLQSLPKKQRHELRRKMRRASSPMHTLEWQYASPNENLEESGDRFLALMRASNPEKAAFLDDPENVDFFKRILPAIARCGWLKLSFMQIDGQDAAAYFSFDYGNRILLYNSGHDPANHPELSPGIVLLANIIKDAIENNRSVFDFLRGDEEYKYRLGGQDTKVMTLTTKLI